MSFLTIIPRQFLVLPQNPLRLPNHNTKAWRNLKNSIATHGLIEPIRVRQYKKLSTRYLVEDGVMRLDCIDWLAKKKKKLVPIVCLVR